MRRNRLNRWLTLVWCLLLPLAFAVQAKAQEAVTQETETAENEGIDEWTVLFYFCGSDLETKYRFATGNLEEISNVYYPDSTLRDFLSYYGQEALAESIPKAGKVNVLLQTGGSSEWHAQDLGMDISADAVQRWRYNTYSREDGLGSDPELVNGYELLETLPLQSMADPGTLSDFIRWGAATCPAKKYALVLWDHGGGAKTGLFIDELFKGDVMYLYELKQALSDGGVHFETLLIDACMMANLETAWAVSDSASYLVSSEEVVPGKGTAIDQWLQGLFAYPACDGEWLGRSICDMTAIKYANENDSLSRSLLTWSVIDLGKIDALVDAVGELFEKMNFILQNCPMLIKAYSDTIYKADEYGDGKQNMRDLGSVLNHPSMIGILDVDLRGKLLKELSDAIVYSLRGSGRSEALGLSFCYPADFGSDALEIYAKNFPLPSYLAYVDAITSWTAPEWVYDKVERLPEIDTIEELQLKAEKEMDEEGMPAILFPDGNYEECFYRLYWKNEETGQILRLGRTSCVFKIQDGGAFLWRANDPMHWPAVEGQLCCIDLVQDKYTSRLYNIPVQIDSETKVFRCGRTLEYTEEGERVLSNYEIYGVWQGYDDDSELMNRSVTPLSMLAGRDYKLLYPIDDGSIDDREFYEAGETQTLYRSLKVEEIPLPPGIYYLEYEVRDTFLRTTLFDRIEIHWDGETMTFPEDFTWEGKVSKKPETGLSETTELGSGGIVRGGSL